MYKNILNVLRILDGVKASDSENWNPFSYGEIVEFLGSDLMGVHLSDVLVLLINYQLKKLATKKLVAITYGKFYLIRVIMANF